MDELYLLNKQKEDLRQRLDKLRKRTKILNKIIPKAIDFFPNPDGNVVEHLNELQKKVVSKATAILQFPLFHCLVSD